MMTDPIADMLTRIRNAAAVRKATVDVPYSKLKAEIARILKEAGYIADAALVEAEPQNILRVTLKYIDGTKPAISNIQRISKPGRRLYAKKGELPAILNNLGIAIVSTSQGLMTNSQARSKGLGGELICEVY